ncbi:hypothetical protein ACQBAU_04560 [Propionibacteriaceae bacterium Y2011]
MTFERLCHDPAFAGEVTTRVAGWTGLARPKAVALADCHVSTSTTLDKLKVACDNAKTGTATLLHSVAVPYPGFGDVTVTAIKPDLVVVASGPAGPVIVIGDVKDYERVRSRIDDGRLLKGFLQVAMGAFAFRQWEEVSDDASVSDFGFLAVPRSAFLQPTVEVERLPDHLDEVRAQWESRLRAVQDASAVDDVATHVKHLHAKFAPDTCRTCSLFNFCRSELRNSTSPESLLVEIGVPVNERSGLLPLLTGGEPGDRANPRSVSRVRATVESVAQSTGQRRLDPAGLPGTVNVVLAKSDAAALGCYGVGVQRVAKDGPRPWTFTPFRDPQAPETRRKLMHLIGREIEHAMGENRKADPDSPAPVHLVVPDRATADVLASTADLLAGVELSRLRWKRDQDMGRELLTYNGEPAVMPQTLEGSRRTAVSFLLEHDRARMLQVRAPVVDLASVVQRHFVPGGAEFEARRLDFVVEWATNEGHHDHRWISDEVDANPHTPGARLTNATSDTLHAALGRVRDGAHGAEDSYDRLVADELQYKADVVDRALAALATVPDSTMRSAYRSLEGDAQRVWRRRRELRASDLVRFGRTYRWWRNQLVELIDQDATCSEQVTALTNPLRAAEQATDAGDRSVAWATVESLKPTVLTVESRRLGAGDRVVLLAVGDEPWVERAAASVKSQKGSIRLDNASAGPLVERDSDEAVATGSVGTLEWDPPVDANLAVGDRIVIARLDWFKTLKSNKGFNVARPDQDAAGGPTAKCTSDSYVTNAKDHRWCCRPHDVAEAEFADEIALRRSRRELNPETWPPVRDADGFEVVANGKPTAADVTVEPAPVPDGVTVDDVD